MYLTKEGKPIPLGCTKSMGRKKSSPISNLGKKHDVVFGVIADIDMWGDNEVAAFISNVTGRSSRVKEVLWVPMPMFTCHTDQDCRQMTLADAAVHSAITNVAAAWDQHALKNSASFKLVLWPRHGTDRGSSKWCLLWSNTGPEQSDDAFVPQLLVHALRSAVSVGFTDVVLFYCYGGNHLFHLPSTFAAATMEPASSYNEGTPLTLTGIMGVRWTADEPGCGSTAALNFLRLGAPVGARAQVARRYIATSKARLFEPVRVNGQEVEGSVADRVHKRHLDPVLVTESVRYVGPAGAPKKYNNAAFDRRVIGGDKRRSDSDAAWKPSRMAEAALVRMVASLKKGELIRVAYWASSTSPSIEVCRGYVVEGGERCMVEYESTDGGTILEELPPPAPCVIVAVQRLQ